MNINIRVAREEDAKRLLEIYAYYVKNTAVTFEYEVPSLEEFTNRVKNTLLKYPYLVAEVDGKIAGYIYAARFMPRAAFEWSVSTSVYLDNSYHRMGLGKMLYARLEEILKQQNIAVVYAEVADPVEEDEYLTHSSERFHEAMGYKLVGRFHGCGNKFGNWYNLLEMEKELGNRECPPKKFIPFSSLNS